MQLMQVMQLLQIPLVKFFYVFGSGIRQQYLSQLSHLHYSIPTNPRSSSILLEPPY